MSTNTDLQTYVETAVADRMGGAKSSAWVWWLFLGGVGAHFAFLYPKNRAVILAVCIVANVLTLGAAGFLLWCLSWPWLCFPSVYRALEAKYRAEVEADLLRQRTLYGQQQSL